LSFYNPTAGSLSTTADGDRHQSPGAQLGKFGGLPAIAKPPSATKLRLARFALLFSLFAWAAYVVEQIYRLDHTTLTTRALVEAGIYMALVSLLTASSAAYLLSRIGYLERMKVHRRTPRSLIDDYFDNVSPTLTVLIPSYREDARVVRQTLLSASLQEYPNLRVVLLIDDPQNPTETEHRRMLERARALPGMVSDSLREPHRQFQEALEAFEREHSDELIADSDTLTLLAEHYDQAVVWFEAEKQTLPRVDHTDEFLALEVFDRMATDLRSTAEAIRQAAADPDSAVSRRRVHQLYLRLERIFKADLTYFERKKYASLSHEPNKAMNLNSYLGLMGSDYCAVPSPEGPMLVDSHGHPADVSIPDSDYVLTLDADSILLPEYCLRLVHIMEQPQNQDVAVAQTPYSAYRGPASELERIAGATTDVQHIVHQGLTSHGATYWVGANAVIRKTALMELMEVEDNSFPIKRFIKDNTVIEDTESSIDLRSRGWRLYNYPERLSYSATPADFGSLVIQRRRWANGGLIILPGLLRLLFTREAGVKRPSLGELFLRTNYLASISWATLSLMLLLFYPFDDQLLSKFALLIALPYFLAQASDLAASGYHRRDILAVYGFNLLLLPVNLAGTIQSIMQAIRGEKIAFARTPKVKNRTVAPWLFVILPLVLVIWAGRTLVIDIENEAYWHGAFAAANLLMTLYACVFLVGIWTMLGDVLANVKDFVAGAPESRPSRLTEGVAEIPQWASVLYVGSSLEEEREKTPLAVALAAQDRFKSEHPLVVPEHFASERSRAVTD
jgi:cellulose synthase/poly-beta-1,6-N-acetylglucosamine synthase-like glycosyltransferase